MFHKLDLKLQVLHKSYYCVQRFEFVARRKNSHVTHLLFNPKMLFPGTGSGVGTYILNLLEDEYPDVYRCVTDGVIYVL